MRNKTLRLSVAVLTFSLGMGVFYLSHFSLPAKHEQKTDFVSQPATSAKQDAPNEFDPWKLPDDHPPLKKGEFILVGHGCGNGYVTGWLAYDGSRLSEGFNAINRKEFEEEITQAGTILERIENYPDKHGKKGLRIIVRGTNEKTGKDYYSILWFGKWFKKETGRSFIDAPNLEIALEFEQKLINDWRKDKK